LCTAELSYLMTSANRGGMESGKQFMISVIIVGSTNDM